MPRKCYEKQHRRKRYSATSLKSALEAVSLGKLSVRRAALNFGVPKCECARYLMCNNYCTKINKHFHFKIMHYSHPPQSR